MAEFVLVHGAGGRGSWWRWTAEALAALGHRATAVDLPCEDDDAGLDAYAATVIEAVGTDRSPDGRVVVGQSLGGFTVPLVVEALGAEQLVLVTAMVPQPGERGGEWWGNVGHEAAVRAVGYADLPEDEMFVHDVPADRLEAAGPPRGQTARVMEDPWPLPAWPDVDTRFVLCTEDRFFPADWMRGLVRDRLDVEPVELRSGHSPHLAVPDEVAGLLHALWADCA